MNRGKILFARKGGICFIKLVGKIRHPVSPGLDRLIDDTVKDESTADIVLDLNEAEHIDSTNLGLMAKVARFTMAKFNRKPVILCRNEDIAVLLRSMGFDRAFTIVDRGDGGPDEFSAVSEVEQTRAARVRMILDSHRTLIAMNKKNRETFKTVVDTFEHEL